MKDNYDDKTISIIELKDYESSLNNHEYKLKTNLFIDGQIKNIEELEGKILDAIIDVIESENLFIGGGFRIYKTKKIEPLSIKELLMIINKKRLIFLMKKCKKLLQEAKRLAN